MVSLRTEGRASFFIRRCGRRTCSKKSSRGSRRLMPPDSTPSAGPHRSEDKPQILRLSAALFPPLGRLPREHDAIHELDDVVDVDWTTKTYKLRIENWTLSYQVGVVWSGPGREQVLWIEPKFEELDMLEMLVACLERRGTAELVLAEPYAALTFWPSDQPLSVSAEAFRDVEPMLAVAYVRRLYDFCIRHLRRGYQQVTRNLV